MAIFKLGKAAPANLGLATIFNQQANYTKTEAGRFVTKSANGMTLEGRPQDGKSFEWAEVLGNMHPTGSSVLIDSFVLKAKNGAVLLTIDDALTIDNVNYDFLVYDVFTADNIATFLFSKKDDFFGTAKADILASGGDDDRLFGGKGGDKLDGGGGIDTVWYKTAVTVDLDTGKYKGEAKGDVYTLVEIFEGSKKNDTFLGTDGKNVFHGMGGNDKLDGRGGNDELLGGDGNDVLIGGLGNNELTGGKGKDDLYAGTGADTFIFESVADFGTTLATADRIFGLKGIEGDDLSFTGDIDFIEHSGAFTAKDQFSLTFDGKDTIVAFNYDDDLAADGFVKIMAWDLTTDPQKGAVVLFL